MAGANQCFDIVDINSSICQHAVRQGTMTVACLILSQLQGTWEFAPVSHGSPLSITEQALLCT